MGAELVLDAARVAIGAPAERHKVEVVLKLKRGFEGIATCVSMGKAQSPPDHLTKRKTGHTHHHTQHPGTATKYREGRGRGRT